MRNKIINLMWKVFVCFLMGFYLQGFGFDEKEFKSTLKNPPSWFEQSIKKDLSKFENSNFGKKNLDNLCSKDFNLVRVKVVNNKLYLTPRKLNYVAGEVISKLEKIKSFKALPNIDFVFSYNDLLTENESLMPIFVVCRKSLDNNFILFPDWTALKGYTNKKHILDKIIKNNNSMGWGKKLSKLYWRGGATGIINDDKWNSPRIKLCLSSLENKKFLDAKMVKFYEEKQDFREEAIKKGIVGNFVSFEDHLIYKYLVDVDGNASTWPRLAWILLAKSVLFKQESPFEQWFYGALKPFEHYIPFKRDLSDIFEQFNWAVSNDGLCNEIANNATNFFYENLREEKVCAYLYLLLKEYAKKQKEVYLVK